MMKWSALAAGAVCCVLAGTTLLSAQLGEVARKEAERRKTVKAAGKTYTNDTIKPDPSPSVSAPSDSSSQVAARETPSDTAASPSPAATPTPISSDPAERRNQENQWREKMKAARESLERAQTFADALQSRINALNTDFVNRDDPAQRAKIGADRDKALADLDKARKEIEQHTKAIAKIQEDARRAGVPAGWVR